jgi:hypothetical protein
MVHCGKKRVGAGEIGGSSKGSSNGSSSGGKETTVSKEYARSFNAGWDDAEEVLNVKVITKKKEPKINPPPINIPPSTSVRRQGSISFAPISSRSSSPFSPVQSPTSKTFGSLPFESRRLGSSPPPYSGVGTSVGFGFGGSRHGVMSEGTNKGPSAVPRDFATSTQIAPSCSLNPSVIGRSEYGKGVSGPSLLTSSPLPSEATLKGIGIGIGLEKEIELVEKEEEKEKEKVLVNMLNGEKPSGNQSPKLSASLIPNPMSTTPTQTRPSLLNLSRKASIKLGSGSSMTIRGSSGST